MNVIVVSMEPYWFQSCLELGNEFPATWRFQQEITATDPADLYLVQLDLSQNQELSQDPCLETLQKQKSPILICSTHSPSLTQCHWLIEHQIPFVHLPLQMTQLWEKMKLCSNSTLKI